MLILPFYHPMIRNLASKYYEDFVLIDLFEKLNDEEK